MVLLYGPLATEVMRSSCGECGCGHLDFRVVTLRVEASKLHRSQNGSRASLANLTSTLGAGVLGVGIGVVATDFLRGTGVALLVMGAIMHGWGMADRHRLEREAPRPPWSAALYLLCWGALAVIATWVVFNHFR